MHIAVCVGGPDHGKKLSSDFTEISNGSGRYIWENNQWIWREKRSW